MLQQVMLDVKLTLFAVFVAIAIACPANDGDNVPVYDYVVATAEADGKGAEPPRPWCVVDPDGPPAPKAANPPPPKLLVSPLVPDDVAGVRRGLVFLAPVHKPGTHQLVLKAALTRLTVATRGGRRVYEDKDLTPGRVVTVVCK